MKEFAQVLGLLIILLGCDRSEQDQRAMEASGAADSVQASVVARASEPDSQSLAVLVDSLRYIAGNFQLSRYKMPSGADRYEFAGDLEYFQRIAAFGDEAVSALVECLDRPESSRVILNGSPVSWGAVCYEALGRFAYFEPTDSAGDSTGWPGSVMPGATESQLRAAKLAWKELLPDRGYILLPATVEPRTARPDTG